MILPAYPRSFFLLRSYFATTDKQIVGYAGHSKASMLQNLHPAHTVACQLGKTSMLEGFYPAHNVARQLGCLSNNGDPEPCAYAKEIKCLFSQFMSLCSWSIADFPSWPKCKAGFKLGTCSGVL